MSTPAAQGIRDQIERTAISFMLPVKIVLAICEVESSLNPWAWNPEPPYRYLVDVRTGKPFRPLTAAEKISEVPPPDFPTAAGDRDAEWWGQQASWGLMQVMGAVAREYGFRGHFPQLCFPTDGLSYGCGHLARLHKRLGHLHGWAGAISAYNCGQPKLDNPYIAKVAKAGAAAFLPGY